jgi:hypothetical protein
VGPPNAAFADDGRLQQRVRAYSLFAAFQQARSTLSLVVSAVLGRPRSLVKRIIRLWRYSRVPQPDGFGGSDGFGTQPGGGEREPRAAWTVAFVTTFAECDAALRAGLRTVALPIEEDGYVDESLEGVADVCVDDLSEVSLDDLSTPGSFWLNPSLPRDAQGFAVDATTGLRFDEDPAAEADEDDDDAAARRMLQDIADLDGLS